MTPRIPQERRLRVIVKLSQRADTRRIVSSICSVRTLLDDVIWTYLGDGRVYIISSTGIRRYKNKYKSSLASSLTAS